MYPFSEFVDAGGLIAYSFDLVELNKRVANDIDAILRGANPGEIPYYQASKFELAINLKTAKALGLTVPATLLAGRQGDRMKRREFMATLGGVAAWPCRRRDPDAGALQPCRAAG